MRWGLILVVAVAAMAVASAEVVDHEGDVGRTTSLALDSNGTVTIFYYDITNEDIKCAIKRNTGWIVDWVGSGDDDFSFAFSPTGTIGVAFQSLDEKELYFKTLEVKEDRLSRIDFYTVDTCDSSVGEYVSLAFDSEGVPHIVYSRESNDFFKYAFLNGSSWEKDYLPIDCGEISNLVFDAFGRLHFVWHARYEPGLLLHLFKEPDSDDWEEELVGIIDDEYSYPSIAVNALGIPHISYYDEENGDLKYATKFFNLATHSYEWESVTVDEEGDVGKYSSIYLDSSGNPHIAYYDETNYDLKYAWKDSNGWHVETVDRLVGKYYNSLGEYGERFISLTVDSDGNPHISYYDAIHDNLKYTSKQPTIVNLQGGITDTSGTSVSVASMRVTIKNSNGEIVYQDVLNDVLSNGEFSILLGATKTLKLWDEAEYYLILEVDIGSTTFNTADVTFGDNQPVGDVIVFSP